ncbi:MAG TPA: glycoside hydrolase family 38 C-terminal domain-containing protein [Nakamurella sp.]|nr:glycoside hydrolase family 38 C-terminal domain-containing protein [Nakamurella sp.]
MADARPDTGARDGARRIYMIGNAHIDPVWLWHWPEGYAEVRATFRSALDRMNEYDEFVFTMDQIVFLAWIEEHDPDMFAEIAERVRQGRWELAGGMWVEPDCNLPSGEAFARHTLYSQRYLHSRFRQIATVGLNADPFGHNAMLPQLLAKSGMDSYLFLRPQVHELTLPDGAFRWFAPDGSSVLAARIPNEYCTSAREVNYQVVKSLAQLPTTDRPLVCFYGVGNHGGGPTKVNIESIREMARRDGTPPLAAATARSYFDAAAGDPLTASFTGELQMHAVGCYSAQSEVKRNNRRCENALRSAEKWATLASRLAPLPDARAELEHAWKQVLFNQFHDILPGSSLPEAYSDARDTHGEAAAIAARVTNRSVQSIARQIDTSAGGPSERGVAGSVPVVVFNPHAFPVSETLEMEFGAFPGPAQVHDARGNPVTVQQIRSESVTSRRRYALRAELPPLGYTTLRFSPATGPDQQAAQPPADLVLDNGILRATIDPATGWLSSLVELASGTELVPGTPGPHAVVLDDPTDTWSHGVRSYREVAGTFRPESVVRVDAGPVRNSVRVTSRYRESTLVEEIRLDAGAQYLDVAVTVNWQQQLQALKLRFPAALDDTVATHEIPYGHLVRPAEGQEVPSHSWVDVTGRAGGAEFGLALINDSKYSFDVDGAEIGMMVLRSPAYAWHDPAVLEPGVPYRFQDQGIQRMRYRLLPHAGGWQTAGVPAAGAVLNEPVTAVLDSNHPGTLPLERSFGRVRSDSVMLTVIKPGEDDPDTVVVRAYETAGTAGTAEFDLPLLGRTVTAEFGACEIKTLVLPADPVAGVTEVNLLEWADETPDSAAGRPESDGATGHADGSESAVATADSAASGSDASSSDASASDASDSADDASPAG